MAASSLRLAQPLIFIAAMIVIIYTVAYYAMRKRRQLFYNKNEGVKTTNNNVEYIRFPLRDESQQPAGELFTRAAQYQNNETVFVINYLTFFLNDGAVSTVITYTNQVNTGSSMISKAVTLESSIASGSGEFVSGRGRVKLTAMPDGRRRVLITCNPW